MQISLEVHPSRQGMLLLVGMVDARTVAGNDSADVDVVVVAAAAVVVVVGMGMPAERGEPSWPLVVTRVSVFATGERRQLATDSLFDSRVCSL